MIKSVLIFLICYQGTLVSQAQINDYTIKSQNIYFRFFLTINQGGISGYTVLDISIIYILFYDIINPSCY